MPRVTVLDSYLSESEGDSVNTDCKHLAGGVNTITSLTVVFMFARSVLQGRGSDGDRHLGAEDHVVRVQSVTIAKASNWI